MILEQIQDLSFVPFEDEDAYRVAKALWAIMPAETHPILREVLKKTLAEDAELVLPEALAAVFIKNLASFRKEVAYAKTQLAYGRAPYARFMFLLQELSYPYQEIVGLLGEAIADGDDEAARTYAKYFILDPSIDASEKLVAAKDIMNNLDGKTGIDLLAMAYDAVGDKKKYFETLMHGMKVGNAYCYWKAAMAFQTVKDYEQAAELFELGRYADDPDALFEYALTYVIKGYGRKDDEKAEELMKRAAYAGSIEAAAHLGKSYLWSSSYREGKPHDYAQAKFFLELADKKDHEDAGYFLGCLHDGFYKDAPQEYVDHERAMSYWSRLAKRSHAGSLMQLGCAYYNGDHGFTKDRELAGAYYRRAASGGNPMAQAYYADMIASGEVNGNKESVIWLLVSAMSAFNKGERDIGKRCLADAYRCEKLFPKDEEWASYIDSFEIEYQGSYGKTRDWIISRLIPAREKHLRLHPELDDGVNYERVLCDWPPFME